MLDYSILKNSDWTIVRVATQMDPPEFICDSIKSAMVDAFENGRFTAVEGEQSDSGEYDADVISELADSAVSVYTASRIREFAGWQDAWSADMNDIGGMAAQDDMISAIGVALYLTYEQAFWSVLTYVRENQPEPAGAWVVTVDSEQISANAGYEDAWLSYETAAREWADRSDELHGENASDLAAVEAALADHLTDRSDNQDRSMAIHANDGNAVTFQLYFDESATPED